MPLAPAQRARLQASLACLGTCIAWRFFRSDLSLALFAAASLLAVLAWLSPRHYAPVQRTLDAVLHALLAGFTWLVLGLVYFGLFTPFRFWRTLTRRDPLALQHPPANDSYLRALPATAPRFDRQF